MIETLVKFVTFLCRFSETEVAEDTWASFSLKGKVKNLNLQQLETLKEDLDDFQAFNLLTFNIEGGEDNLGLTDIEPYTKGQFAERSWAATFSKHAFLNNFQGNNEKFTFFLSTTACLAWLNAVNIFDRNSPIYIGSSLTIFVGDLKESIGNELLGFCPLDTQAPSRLVAADNSVPDYETLKSVIHFVTENNFLLDPRRLLEGL